MICHLILFIILAVALSDFSLPMAAFNTLMSYIMIMSGLDAGMLSASHCVRMKWINKPEGTESGGSCMCERSVFVCLTALGDPSAQPCLASYRFPLFKRSVLSNI